MINLFDIAVIYNTCKFSAYLVFIFGIISIFCVLLFGLINFMNNQKFIAPKESRLKRHMLRFELSNTSDEVFDLLGEYDSKQGRINRSILNLQNLAHMFIPLSYSLLIASIFLFIFFLNRDLKFVSYILTAGMILSIIMFLSDITENSILVKLTSYIDKEEINESLMTHLKIWSRSKFTAIFISSILLSYMYLR